MTCHMTPCWLSVGPRVVDDYQRWGLLERCEAFLPSGTTVINEPSAHVDPPPPPTPHLRVPQLVCVDAQG